MKRRGLSDEDKTVILGQVIASIFIAVLAITIINLKVSGAL